MINRREASPRKKGREVREIKGREMTRIRGENPRRRMLRRAIQ